MISPREGLERLRDGNRRYVSGGRVPSAMMRRERRTQLLDTQTPFAAILGCSDSRAPVEIVFDQDIGDLFVIRVAGNVAGLSQLGSVEFTVEHFGTRLVVVLGHSNCGAVQATLDELQRPTRGTSRNVLAILDRIRPAVEPLMETELRQDPAALLRQAVRANVRATTNQLRHGSAILERRILEDGLLVVGAEYSLETGIIDFFDGVPDEASSPPRQMNA